MQLLYNFGILAYSFFVRLCSFFSPKAKDWIDGRKDFFNHLPHTNNREVIWFHCASLGEFDQGLPLMHAIRDRFSDAFILVTFFSPSGYNHYHKRQHPADFVCYLPTDRPKNARRFIAYFRPTTCFFIKYEFWHHHIRTAKKAGAKIYSVSTALRPSQIYFRWYGRFFRTILLQVDYFFVQNKRTQDLLHSIGIQQTVISGDTRFDRVIDNKKNWTKNTIISQFVGESKSVFIAGSTWPEDEKLLLTCIEQNLFDKYIFAPHTIDDAHIDSLENRLPKASIRYSNPDNYDCNSLIINTIGHLSTAYSYAQVAYVGGGFSGSLHNILEPAVFGLPVLFGPKFTRFPEAQAFIDAGIGFSVKNPAELLQKMEYIKKNKDSIAQKSKLFVEQNKGATKKIMDFIYPLLSIK